MTNISLKANAARGIFWAAVDRFGAFSGQFLVGVVLARLLTPEDFGLVGMLSVFVAISQTFVDSGMASGLIQKTSRSDIDFSTVFVFNFVVSILFYCLLFCGAPYIAEFYGKPPLVLLTRVLVLDLVVNSLAVVQRTKLVIQLDFKTMAKVSVVKVFGSGIIGIVFAACGYGVWALVFQTILGSAITVIMYWSLSNWRPSVKFSWESFSELFGFGSKLLLASIYAQGFNNIYNIVIGKAYSASELGYYTRAKAFTETASGAVSAILQQVTYPMLASLRNDKERMVFVYRKLIRVTAFVIFPSMALLAVLASPLVQFLLSEKWLSLVPLMHWLCLARVFTPISALNMNILNATGRSDLFLKVDLSKTPLIIFILIVTIPLGVKGIVIGHAVTSSVAFFINAYLPGKYFGYGAFQQLKDITPIIIASCISALVAMASIIFIQCLWLQIITGCIIGSIVYYLIAALFGVDEIKEVHVLLNRLKIGFFTLLASFRKSDYTK